MVSTHMKAVSKTGVGKVALKTIEIPKPGRGQVLVQIFAAALGKKHHAHSDWLGTSPENGDAFAEYCVADAMLLVDIPDDTSFESASTLGLAAFTACQILWQSQKLPIPVDVAKDPFLILAWGEASAVDQFVIQLAKQSGLQVITTASPQNHESLRKLSADAVFDYRDPKVISNVKTFCGDKKLHLAIGAPCKGENKMHQVRLHPIEGKYAYLAIPEHFKFGKWCAVLLRRLAKTLSVTPIRVVPNGLADAQYWIDYQEEGKASPTIKLCSVIC
ncbi:dehydrogenase [Lentinula lateritia]|nr:dehydrogenase [Lentinula lateritia]